jgi:EmrB/QacA subfamily drug resistance transporter
MIDQNTLAVPIPARPATDYRAIALIIGCAVFIEQVDGTVLATALPTMARDFHVAAPAMSIAVTSYLLALAVLIPISGTIADRFGAKRVFSVSIAVFVVGSILCSLTRTLPMMVCARLVQGLGGAMMTPIGRLILLRTVERRHMVSAVTLMFVPVLLGTMAGPPLGGLIVQYLDWHWIFYLNVPIGALGFWLVNRFIPAIESQTAPGRFDWLGFAFCSSGLASLMFGLELLGESISMGIVLALLSAAGASLLLYYLHARRIDNPLLDLSLLQIPSYRISVISGSLMRITQGAQPFLLPLLFQVGLGFSAVHSGQLILAISLGALCSRISSARLLRQFGYRRAMIVSSVLASIGYALCGLFRADWPFWLMFAVLACSGACMSFQFAAYNTVAYEAVPQQRMSAANSLYTTLQQLLLSVGVCCGGLILKMTMAAVGRSDPAPGNFTAAFAIVSLISITATWWNRKFAPDVGQELSGHRRNEPVVVE